MTDASERSSTTSRLSLLMLILLLPAVLVMVVTVTSSAGTADACPSNEYETTVSERCRLENDDLMAGKPRVIKCCPAGKVKDKNNYKCSRCNATHQEFAVPKFGTVNKSVEIYETVRFHITYLKLNCTNNAEKYQLIPSNTSDSNSFDGSEDEWLMEYLKSKYVTPGQFCLDQLLEMDFKSLSITCQTNENGLAIHYTAIFCYDMIDTKGNGLSILNTVAMMVSLPYFLMTFLVYTLIKKLRNLHGKSLMCHVAALLVAFTSLIIIQFISNQIEKNVCILFGFIIQFSFLASFFWLNVMCFDLWWTFSGFRPLKGNLRQHESKRFKIYSIYAWGCSSVISILTYYMQAFYSASPFSPGLGEKQCWFNSNLTTFIYFYCPIAILSCGDLLMFLFTAVKIARNIRDTKIINNPEHKRKIDHNKQRFVLYLKLFIVMGINWMAEILSWAFEKKDGVTFWIITDLVNALQGVFIFLIFVCKKRVLRLLCEKLCLLSKHFNKSTMSSSTRTHYSSTISKTTKTSTVS